MHIFNVKSVILSFIHIWATKKPFILLCIYVYACYKNQIYIFMHVTNQFYIFINIINLSIQIVDIKFN